MDPKPKRKAGRPPTAKCDPDAIIAAIQDSAGVRSVVAARLGVCIPTLDKYLGKYPRCQEAMHAEETRMNDVAEKALYANIRKGNEKAIEFFLERRMPEKYGKRPDAMIGVNVEGSVTIEQMMRKAGESWEIGGRQDE